MHDFVKNSATICTNGEWMDDWLPNMPVERKEMGRWIAWIRFLQLTINQHSEAELITSSTDWLTESSPLSDGSSSVLKRGKNGIFEPATRSNWFAIHYTHDRLITALWIFFRPNQMNSPANRKSCASNPKIFKKWTNRERAANSNHSELAELSFRETVFSHYYSLGVGRFLPQHLTFQLNKRHKVLFREVKCEQKYKEREKKQKQQQQTLKLFFLQKAQIRRQNWFWVNFNLWIYFISLWPEPT